MTQESEQEKKPQIVNVNNPGGDDKRDNTEENRDQDVIGNADGSNDGRNDAQDSETDEDDENDGESDDRTVSDDSFASEDEENGSPNESKVTSASSPLPPEYNEPPSPPGEKCPICLNSLSLGQDIGTPDSCQGIHHFCLDCIEEWSANVNTCPVDRKEFTLVLVKRELTGAVIEKISVKSRSVVLTFDDGSDRLDAQEEDDLTFCEICGRCDHEDRLLLCDGCDFGYHCDCLDPPILEIPIEEWFCPDCITRLFGSPSDGQTTFDQELNRLRRSRRNGSGRVIARTRASEVVRNRIIARRTQSDHLDDVITHVATNLNVPVASSSSAARRSAVTPQRTTYRTKRRSRKTKRSKSTKGRSSGRKSRRKGKSVSRKGRSRKAIASNRALPAPLSVRERLSAKLGLIRKKSHGPHSLPLMTKSCSSKPKSISDQREYAGIPPLSLMGHGLSSFGAVPIFGDDDEENVSYNTSAVVSANVGSGATSVLSNARVNITSNILSMKSVNSSASETSDLLGSILAGQEILHAESSRVMITRDGTLKLNSTQTNWSAKKRVCTSDTSTENNKSEGTSSSPNRNNNNGNSGNNESINCSRNGSGPSGEGKDSSSSSSSPVRSSSPVNRSDDVAAVRSSPISTCVPGSIPLKKRKIEQSLEDTKAPQVKSEVTESPVEADIFSDIEPMTDDSPNLQSPGDKDKENTPSIDNETVNDTQVKQETVECNQTDTNADETVTDAQDNVLDESSKSLKSPVEQTKKKDEDDSITPVSSKDSKDEVRVKKCKHGKIHTKSSRDKNSSAKSTGQTNSTGDIATDAPSASDIKDENCDKKSRLNDDSVKSESDSTPSSSCNLRGTSIFDLPSIAPAKSSDQSSNRSSDSSKKRSYRDGKDDRDRNSNSHSYRDSRTSSSRSSYSSNSHNRSHHSDNDRKYSSSEFTSDSRDHRSRGSYKDSKTSESSSSSYSRDKHPRRSSRDESDHRKDLKSDESDLKGKKKFSSSSTGYNSDDRDRSRRKESDRSYSHSLSNRSYDRFDDSNRPSDSEKRKKYESSASSKRNQTRASVKSVDGSDDERTSQPTPTQDEGSSPAAAAGSHNSNSVTSNYSSSRGNMSKITRDSLDGIRDWITSSGKNVSTRQGEQTSKIGVKKTVESNLSTASSLFDQLKASVSHTRSTDSNSTDLKNLLHAVQSGLLTSGEPTKQSNKESIKSKSSRTPQYSDNSSDSGSAGSMPYSPSEDYDTYSGSLGKSGESLCSSADFKAAVDQILSSAQQQQQQQQQPASSSSVSNMFKKPRPPVESPAKNRLKTSNAGDSDALTSARELDKKEKYIQKLNRQERVVEEVKVVLKPFYQAREIDKSQYKEIMRKAVPKICHDKTGQIIPVKIKALVEKYVDQAKHQKSKSTKPSKQQSTNSASTSNT